LDCQKVFDLGGVVSGKSPGVGGRDGFLWETLNKWVEIGEFLKGW